MKKYIDIKTIKITCLTVTMALLVICQTGFAQEKLETKSVKKIRPILKIMSIKDNNNSRAVIGNFSYKDKKAKAFYKVKGIPLKFYVGIDSIINLGAFTTNEEGKAVCSIDPNIQLPKDEEGYIHFAVEFKGNKLFKASTKNLDLIDLQMEMSLDILDSVKTITIIAEKILNNNEKVPVDGEKVPIYVERMFSELKIGEAKLVRGKGIFELPDDIPGDTLGLINLIAKFEDHDDFADVSKSERIAWGIVTFHHEIYHPRSLWTQVAPIWMIVTLSVMLLGVWGHYIYVIFEMIKLKKGRKEIA